MEAWGFIWLMFILKIPILMLFGIVYWAWKQEPDYADDESPGGGGAKNRPHPPRRPRRRPRGPHGDPAPLPAPPRSRKVRARGRRVGSS